MVQKALPQLIAWYVYNFFYINNTIIYNIYIFNVNVFIIIIIIIIIIHIYKGLIQILERMVLY